MIGLARLRANSSTGSKRVMPRRAERRREEVARWCSAWQMLRRAVECRFRRSYNAIGAECRCVVRYVLIMRERDRVVRLSIRGEAPLSSLSPRLSCSFWICLLADGLNSFRFPLIAGTRHEYLQEVFGARHFCGNGRLHDPCR